MEQHLIPITNTQFEVCVSKEAFKFNAAHFVAFKGFRERLHGHNYHVAVRLLGQRQIGADGYLIDFGEIKKVVRSVCKRLNERFLCPTLSDVISITTNTATTSSGCDSQGIEQEQVRLECEDGAVFSFPASDCAMLPIVHATTEELSIYLWSEIVNGLNASYLLKRKIHTMEITVAEAPGQESTFRLEIPRDLAGTSTSGNSNYQLDVREFIMKGEVVVQPCKAAEKDASECCPDCQSSKKKLWDQLNLLAKAINDRGLPEAERGVTAEFLEKLVYQNNV